VAERPPINSTAKITRNTKNKILAMAKDAPAIPVKPRRPAARATTRKMTA